MACSELLRRGYQLWSLGQCRLLPRLRLELQVLQLACGIICISLGVGWWMEATSLVGLSRRHRSGGRYRSR